MISQPVVQRLMLLLDHRSTKDQKETEKLERLYVNRVHCC
jgi:hypothetical protein